MITLKIIMEKYINIKGINTFYKIEGKGEPLILLHGWGEQASNHFKFITPLIKNKYKIIILDLPGFGKTGKPKKPWNVSDYVDFVTAFVNKLKLKNFNLLGFSFGGRISIKLASKYGYKINETLTSLNKLFLVSSAGIGVEKAEQKNTSFLFAIFKKIPFLRFIAYKLIYRKSDYYKLRGVMKQTFKNIINEDLTSELKNIKTRVIIIWGKEDNITTLKSARLINKNIKNSRLYVINGIGHFGFLKYKAREIAKIILQST